MTPSVDGLIGSIASIEDRYLPLRDLARQLEREVAALTTELYRYNHWTPDHTVEQWIEELTIQRDELQKRIGYTAVPQESPCESQPEENIDETLGIIYAENLRWVIDHQNSGGELTNIRLEEITAFLEYKASKERALGVVIDCCYEELKKALGRDIECPAYIPDAIRELAREVAALTTQRDELTRRLADACSHANWSLLNRAEAAEAQRDELQKRIGYTDVPSDRPCESPPHVVPFADYMLARNALLYWRYECSGNESSLSLFERMVDEALSQQHDFDEDAKDAGRWRLLRSLQNEGFGEVLAEEAFAQQVPALLIETGDIEAIMDYMIRTQRGLQRIDTGTAQATECETNGTEGLRAELDAAKRALADVGKIADELENCAKNAILRSDEYHMTSILQMIRSALAAKSPLG